MVEYSILVTLVVFGALGVVGAIGGDVVRLFVIPAPW
jgi:hypothetical protein